MEGVIADFSKLKDQIRNMKTMQHVLLDLASSKAESGDSQILPKFRALADSYLIESQLIKSADYLTTLDHEESVISATFEALMESKTKREGIAKMYQRLTGMQIRVERQEVESELDLKTTTYHASQTNERGKVTMEARGEISDLDHRLMLDKHTYNLHDNREVKKCRDALGLSGSSARHRI